MFTESYFVYCIFCIEVSLHSNFMYIAVSWPWSDKAKWTFVAVSPWLWICQHSATYQLSSWDHGWDACWDCSFCSSSNRRGPIPSSCPGCSLLQSSNILWLLWRDAVWFGEARTQMWRWENAVSTELHKARELECAGRACHGQGKWEICMNVLLKNVLESNNVKHWFYLCWPIDCRNFM